MSATRLITRWRLGSGIAFLLAGEVAAAPVETQPAPLPHIVVILADDLGFGDVQHLSPGSRLSTPNLDRLAGQGMSFTDAHSPSAVCTPTRYGLLTGRYSWRTRLKRGVLGGYSPPLIEGNRPTLPSLLKKRGYFTACVGKWHLGMALPMLPKDSAGKSTWKGDPGVNFDGIITDGPTHHGFDYFFGVSASLDMPPYVLMENDRFISHPTLQQPSEPFPGYVRAGPRAEDFVIDEMLDRLTDKAVEIVAGQSERDSPLFLYLPLTAPHKPTVPEDRFRGQSGLGPYGDLVTQVDAAVGRLLQALEDARIADHTLVFLTSDNGSYMHRYDDPLARDHVDDASIQGYRGDRHRANGPFRGTKADIWEAGHRVPFLVRWPGTVKPGSTCTEPICLTDVLATCADAGRAPIDPGAAEDSYSLLGLLKGMSSPRPQPVVHHSAQGMFAIRRGNWKLVLGNGSGGRERPSGKPFQTPFALFNLVDDPTESANLAAQHPEIVEQLTHALQRIRDRIEIDATNPE